MNYECVQVRFLFFNGQARYTVEYAYAISAWYVFQDEKHSDSLWSKKINPSNHKSPNRINAEAILMEYLEQEIKPAPQP